MTAIGAVFTYFMFFCFLLVLACLIERDGDYTPPDSAEKLSLPVIVLLAIVAGAATMGLAWAIRSHRGFW